MLLPDSFEEQPHLQVLVMCDSYIGLDQQYTLDLNKVNQIIESQAAESKRAGAKKNQNDEQKVAINVKVDQAASERSQPSQISTSMIKTGGPETGADMPSTFQLYSELSQKVLGGDQRHLLIASDGDGRDRDTDTESSFEFDVAADDIYDLTFF